MYTLPKKFLEITRKEKERKRKKKEKGKEKREKRREGEAGSKGVRKRKRVAKEKREEDYREPLWAAVSHRHRRRRFYTVSHRNPFFA